MSQSTDSSLNDISNKKKHSHLSPLKQLCLLSTPAAASLVATATVWVDQLVLASEESESDEGGASAWRCEHLVDFKANPFPQLCALLMPFVSERPSSLHPLSSSSSSEEALPSTALCRHSTSADREEMDSLHGCS